MYYPKSQITTNLYTNGDKLMYKSNSIPYMGYYWTTSTGKIYTGKTPEDTPTEELIELNIPRASQNLTNQEAIFNNVESNINLSLKVYSSLIPSPSSLFLPTYFQPQPTSQDYQTGEFRRYFVKKTNELIYIEVSKDTYDNILNQNSQWLWQDYLPFNIPWSISGNKLTIAKTNKNIVDLIMLRLSLYKFNDYLRNDYTKFYK
jgi:hypothetical protein